MISGRIPKEQTKSTHGVRSWACWASGTQERLLTTLWFVNHVNGPPIQNIKKGIHSTEQPSQSSLWAKAEMTKEERGQVNLGLRESPYSSGDFLAEVLFLWWQQRSPCDPDNVMWHQQPPWHQACCPPGSGHHNPHKRCQGCYYNTWVVGKEKETQANLQKGLRLVSGKRQFHHSQHSA